MRISTVATRAATSAAAQALRLSQPLTRQVSSRRGLAVRARDGVILRTDHYAPAVADAPTVLVRTPYGRGGVTGLAARLLAERGFHVVLQSCRGTTGSGGVFEPMRHERDDGLDTVAWLRRQPWFTGVLGTFGPSYVGYTQWAIADVPELAALATVVTASSFRDPVYAGASFALFTTLAWATLLAAQTQSWTASTIEVLRGRPQLKRAFAQLPLREADQLATGAEVAFFREWLALANEEESGRNAYWAAMDHGHRLPGLTAPVLMVGGWYDIFLPWQLRDYATLIAAGAQPYLTIGPWTHGSGGLLAASVRESIDWLRGNLRGERDAIRSKPVRLYVTGADEWRDFDAWPPPVELVQPWYLEQGGRLTPVPDRESGSGPAADSDERSGTRSEPRPIGTVGPRTDGSTNRSTVDTFRYDPADPTPTVGGPLLLANVSGPRDNRAVEARPDVLVYTSSTMDAEVEIIGPVSATVHVRASERHHDIFVRLCDVDPRGRSINICDGLARVRPGSCRTGPGGTSVVDVELWPAAHRFRRGHRIRVQISGGSHPRYARNPGTADALATATEMRPVEIEVWHDADRPSFVNLPIAKNGSAAQTSGT